jgi:ketosteroid isomerase-like protein
MKYYWMFALCFLAACAGNDKQNSRVDIRALNQQFITAWNNDDTARIRSFMADDIQFLQAHTHYKGKAEVSEKWVRESLPAISNLKTSVVSSGVTDSIAYEAGTFSVDVTAPDQPDAFGEGNYILLWKVASDGTWKLAYAQLEDLPLQLKNQ